MSPLFAQIVTGYGDISPVTPFNFGRWAHGLPSARPAEPGAAGANWPLARAAARLPVTMPATGDAVGRRGGHIDAQTVPAGCSPGPERGKQNARRVPGVRWERIGVPGASAEGSLHRQG